jgi:hypothetical protein
VLTFGDPVRRRGRVGKEKEKKGDASFFLDDPSPPEISGIKKGTHLFSLNKKGDASFFLDDGLLVPLDGPSDRDLQCPAHSFEDVGDMALGCWS